MTRSPYSLECVVKRWCGKEWNGDKEKKKRKALEEVEEAQEG
jgi:hypothetical protein